MVDYVLVNSSLFDHFLKFEVCEPNILSDHCAVQFSLTTRVGLSSMNITNTNSNSNVNKSYKWNDEKADQYTFHMYLNGEKLDELNLDLQNATSSEHVNQNIKKFEDVMSNICDPLFSKKAFFQEKQSTPYTSTKHTPWFDDECDVLRKLFYDELSKFRQDKTIENQSNLVRARANYKRLIRQKRFNFDKDKTSKLLELKYKNAKEYWKLLKQAANLNNKNSISIDTFSEYFKSINDPNDRFYQADEDVLFFNERYLKGEIQIMFEELNVPITVEEIRKCIKELKNGASAGPDLILNEFLKRGTNGLLQYLLNLYNKLFEIGYFPENWSEGYIVPIFKKGDKEEASNYRASHF